MNSTNLSQPYPAGKLELHSRQIWLVTILPGRYVDVIACELRTAYLESLPDYYSLSYAWGDRTDVRHILLDGVSFNVTRNLEAALRRLRHPTEPRVFWIDMICIDQDNVEERTHQVNLMHLTYSRAREVFLWLGDYAETILPKAGPCLGSTEDEEFLDQIEVVRALSYIERLSSDRHLGFSEQGVLPLHLAAEIHALDRLMRTSWWHRVWTIQEAILPPKTTVIVGWLQFSWNTLTAAAQNFFRHHAQGCCSVNVEFGLILNSFYEKVDSIQYDRTAYHEGTRLNLLNLLHVFRHRLCTDPRDKIFGLLGLVARDQHYHALRADYTLSTETSYRESFTHLLRSGGSLNLLARPEEEGRTLDLPTWVPDWTAKVKQLETDTYEQFNSSLGIYNTSLSTLPEIRFPDLITTLGVKGLLFDEVTTLAEPYRNYLDSDPESGDAYLKYIETLLDIKGRESQSYVGGGDRQHALSRLMTMDQILVRSDDFLRGRYRRATLEDHGKPIDIFFSRGNSEAPFWSASHFRVFISKLGYFGLGPKNMRVGDTVHILLGGSVPFVLRRATQETAITAQVTSYKFVGNCYVQGIMDGEALSNLAPDKLTWVSLV